MDRMLDFYEDESTMPLDYKPDARSLFGHERRTERERERERSPKRKSFSDSDGFKIPMLPPDLPRKKAKKTSSFLEGFKIPLLRRSPSSTSVAEPSTSAPSPCTSAPSTWTSVREPQEPSISVTSPSFSVASPSVSVPEPEETPSNTFYVYELQTLYDNRMIFRQSSPQFQQYPSFSPLVHPPFYPRDFRHSTTTHSLANFIEMPSHPQTSLHNDSTSSSDPDSIPFPTYILDERALTEALRDVWGCDSFWESLSQSLGTNDSTTHPTNEDFSSYPPIDSTQETIEQQPPTPLPTDLYSNLFE